MLTQEGINIHYSDNGTKIRIENIENPKGRYWQLEEMDADSSNTEPCYPISRDKNPTR